MQQTEQLFCPKKVVGIIEFLYLGSSFNYKTNTHEKNCLTTCDANAIPGISF